MERVFRHGIIGLGWPHLLAVKSNNSKDRREFSAKFGENMLFQTVKEY